MNDVVVPIVNLEAGYLPQVCVQTGAAATTTIKVRSNKARNRLAWLFWLLGPLGFLLARIAMTSRFTAQLPVAEDVSTRHQQWRVGLGVAYAMTWLSIRYTFSSTFFVLLIGCMIASAVFHRAFPRVTHRTGATEAILTGAHDNFTQALRAGPPTRTGPDWPALPPAHPTY